MNEPGIDQRGEAATKRAGGNAVCTDGELSVRGENDQAAVLGKLRSWIEGQKRIQDGDRPIPKDKQLAGFAYVAIDLPFLDAPRRLEFSGIQLAFHQGKRHRPPPEGRRYMSRLHFPSPFFRQKKSAHQTGAKDS